MPTRLEQLQKMLERDPNDTFLLYGIAMEHKKADDFPGALKMLEQVIELEPGHGYAFFQRGQIHETLGDIPAARQAYEAGIIAATQSNDAHARSELEGALAMIES